jgi:riboflavin transporter FmnP
MEENKVIEQDVETKRQQKSRKWTKLIARVGIFGAISALFYIIPVPPFNFPIFPGQFGFLNIHLDEIPALIAGFAYGPVAGSLVLLIRTLIKLPLTSTALIGELADLIYSLAFIIPAAIIYKQNRKFSTAIIALVIANFVQVGVATIVNFYLIYDLYNTMFFAGAIPFSKEAFVAIIPPFNLIKNAIVIVITLLVYKSTKRLVEKI